MPLTEVSLKRASDELPDLIRRVRDGEEIIISESGEQLAMLVGLAGPAHIEPRKPGALKGRLNFPDSFYFDPLPEDELKLWSGEGETPK